MYPHSSIEKVGSGMISESLAGEHRWKKKSLMR
jgi:hypothetical protein